MVCIDAQGNVPMCREVTTRQYAAYIEEELVSCSRENVGARMNALEHVREVTPGV